MWAVDGPELNSKPWIRFGFFFPCLLGYRQLDFLAVPAFGFIEFCSSRALLGKSERNREPQMSYRREHRASRSALFDSLEEGGLRATSSIDIKEHDNDKSVDSLHDRVAFLKMLTGDIHEEVESHNRMLDKMGNNMDASRGIISGTMDRFKMVFEKKSNRKMCSLVACLITCFLLMFYLVR